MNSNGNFTNDIVIIDELETCPYLADETARMPLQMPATKIGLEEADRRLACGYRRTGEFVYNTKCPECTACQGVRVNCQAFVFSRNQRRVLNHNDRRLKLETGALAADQQRVDLFNKHRRFRGLAKRENDIELDEYIWGFVRSCFESFEMSYWLDDQLIALAVCDKSEKSISAVYTYYDPDWASASVGTYSILKQIQWCRQRHLPYLYLGYYIERSPKMRYKERFMPQERLIDGQWVSFERSPSDSQ